MPKKYLTPNLVKFLAVAIVSFGLIFLNPGKIFNPIREILLEIAYPFQKTFYLMGRTVSGTFEFLGSISSLKKENENLLKENNVLIAKITLLEDEKKENAILRSQLELAPRQKFNLEASFIIGQDPQRLGSWILIDKGGSSGIKPGMPVIVYEGILIGRVEEVSPSSSRVVLLTDSKSAVNVNDVETGARGILRGEYGLGITMDMVTQAETLNTSDAVTTSGLGGDFPKGLLIGKIQEIKMTEDKLFQQAVIIPRVKYSDLKTVFVIKN